MGSYFQILVPPDPSNVIQGKFLYLPNKETISLLCKMECLVHNLKLTEATVIASPTPGLGTALFSHHWWAWERSHLEAVGEGLGQRWRNPVKGPQVWGTISCEGLFPLNGLVSSRPARAPNSRWGIAWPKKSRTNKGSPTTIWSRKDITGPQKISGTYLRVCC